MVNLVPWFPLHFSGLCVGYGAGVDDIDVMYFCVRSRGWSGVMEGSLGE